MKKKFITFYVVAFIFASAFFFASPTCVYGNSLPAPTGTITYFQNVDSSIKWSCFCVVVLLLVVDVLLLKNTKPGKALRTTLLYLYAFFSFSLGAFFEAELLPGNEKHDERPLSLIISVSLLIFLVFVAPLSGLFGSIILKLKPVTFPKKLSTPQTNLTSC